MFDSFILNPYLLAICTISGAIVGFGALFVGKKKKRISYCVRTYSIFQFAKNPIDKLNISYNGDDIKNLYITKIAFWNSGNEVINATDVVSDRPLSISLKSDNHRILDSQISLVTDTTNKFVVENDSTDKYVKIGFEYVESKDGFIIQFLHTGENPEFEVGGKIKGGSIDPVEKYRKKRKQRKFSLSFHKTRTVTLVLSVILLLSLAVPLAFLDLYYTGLISRETFFKVMYFGIDDVDKEMRKMLFLVSLLFILMAYRMIRMSISTLKLKIPVKMRSEIYFNE